MQDDFYTIDGAAEKLKVTARYVRDKIASGELKAHKQGKRIYILHSDMIEYIKAG